jgi:Ca2+-binding EF-hand superfamily protein
VIEEPVLAASPERLQQATSVLEEEKQQAVASNLILQTLQRANVPSEKPLTYLNVFKFFEEFMDKKFEVDTADFAALRRPRTITEFVMEHLIRQFGIKQLAVKFLGQLLPGLKILFKENNPYAILFARLLQLFHPDPIQFPLALFLTRIRPEFHTLIDKCCREREVREKRSSKKPAKGTTFGRAQSDLAATGGEAFTADAILLVYDIFANDYHSGVLALHLLKPEGISLVDYVLFCVCHKMAKQGNTPEAVFNLIDKDGGGSIDQGEFVQGIKTSLDLWLSEEDITEVHVALAVNGQLSKAAFLSRCNFDWYQAVVKSDEYITTKCKFLNMLIDVFNRKQTNNAAQLLDLFHSRSEDPMTKETFTNVLKTLDPERNTDTRIEKMWSTGLGLSAGATALSQAAFIKVMLQYPSGQFALSKFCKNYSDIPEIESAVEERSMETVDINLKEAPSKKGGMVATIKTSSTAKVAAKKPTKK